jgi:hypothetical protein
MAEERRLVWRMLQPLAGNSAWGRFPRRNEIDHWLLCEDRRIAS